jgi:chromosome segregation ATPase
MKNWKNLKLILPLLAMMLSVHAAFAQSPAPQTNSASASPKSDTDANRNVQSSEFGVQSQRKSTPNTEPGTLNLIGACAAAAEDLKATRALAAALETENGALKRQLETTKQSVDLLNELNQTRKSETDSLRETVTAKNEVIAAKDTVIASQDKLIEALKKKKSSPWKRLGDVLIGAALFAILK